MSEGPNIHATAIVVRDQGFLLLGQSGSGKSAAALAIIAAAERENHFAALVADDQVFVSSRNGRLIARCAPTIQNLLEIRGGGIVEMPTISRCVLNFAVQLVPPNSKERIPAANGVYEIEGMGSLPMVRLPFPSTDPWSTLNKLLFHGRDC